MKTLAITLILALTLGVSIATAGKKHVDVLRALRSDEEHGETNKVTLPQVDETLHKENVPVLSFWQKLGHSLNPFSLAQVSAKETDQGVLASGNMLIQKTRAQLAEDLASFMEQIDADFEGADIGPALEEPESIPVRPRRATGYVPPREVHHHIDLRPVNDHVDVETAEVNVVVVDDDKINTDAFDALLREQKNAEQTEEDVTLVVVKGDNVQVSVERVEEEQTEEEQVEEEQSEEEQVEEEQSEEEQVEEEQSEEEQVEEEQVEEEQAEESTTVVAIKGNNVEVSVEHNEETGETTTVVSVKDNNVEVSVEHVEAEQAEEEQVEEEQAEEEKVTVVAIKGDNAKVSVEHNEETGETTTVVVVKGDNGEVAVEQLEEETFENEKEKPEHKAKEEEKKPKEEVKKPKEEDRGFFGNIWGSIFGLNQMSARETNSFRGLSEIKSTNAENEEAHEETHEEAHEEEAHEEAHEKEAAEEAQQAVLENSEEGFWESLNPFSFSQFSKGEPKKAQGEGLLNSVFNLNQMAAGTNLDFLDHNRN